MPLSVRLDKKTESLLEQTASALKTSKAEVIKKSLSVYCTRVLTEKNKRPYELIKDLLGKEGSGKGDLSLRSEDILRRRFKKNHP
jgi:hypothetical protein